MLRSHLLFIHVASALGVFLALGVESVALAQLRRTMGGDTAHLALADLSWAWRLSTPAMLLLVVSGYWLATVYWHWQGLWIRLGFLGLIAVGAVGGVLTGRAMRRLNSALNAPGFDVLVREANPLLRRSFGIRFLILVVVIYLMTVKPL